MLVKDLPKELHLSYIAANFEELCKEAKATKASYEDFLLDIFSLEVENRLHNRLQKRLQEAHFPYRKYLQDLELGEYDTDVRSQIDELATLQFISEKENIICIGNP